MGAREEDVVPANRSDKGSAAGPVIPDLNATVGKQLPKINLVGNMSSRDHNNF